MLSVSWNVWLLFKKPCAHHHSREVTSSAPSQEAWPADRSCTASAKRELTNSGQASLGRQRGETPSTLISTRSTMAATAAFPCSCTHWYSDPCSGGWTRSPQQILWYRGESSMGVWWSYHLLNLMQESKINKGGCQNCSEASLNQETTPQCDHLPLSTPDITADQNHPLYSTGLLIKEPRFHFTPPWRSKQTATNTVRIVVVLGTVCHNVLVFLSPMYDKASSSTSWWWHHTDARRYHYIFRHGHCLSHHMKWSLHEHQQVLWTGFLCTAWISHSWGKWISAVPCREAVLFQTKQKPQTKWNKKYGFFPPKQTQNWKLALS